MFFAALAVCVKVFGEKHTKIDSANQQPRSNLDSLPCPDYLAVVCVRLCPIFINRGPATVLIHGHSPNRRKCHIAYQDIHVKRLGGSDAWLYFQMSVCRARPSDMSRRLFYPFLLCPWLGTARTVPGQLVRALEELLHVNSRLQVISTAEDG
jgi:hypothetical protein